MKTEPLRLAMLGMVPGNGHPYSWSAIINGYDPDEMAKCPYPVIPRYLGAQSRESVRIAGAAVTHIWTDDPHDAEKVARASSIPFIARRMEDVIGQVDGVIIATDDGTDHVRRARPFIEAGLPVFIDKPLAITRDELAQFITWKKQGARILSSSGMRYAPEIQELTGKPWRWLTAFTCKSWESYGIHALEPLLRILGAGFQEVRSEARPGSDIVYLSHRSGAQATLAAIDDAPGSFGVLHAYGTTEHASVVLKDTYTAFRGQMLAVVQWMQTGDDPYPFMETVELMAVIIATIESRSLGRRISVEQIIDEISAPK